MNDTLSLRDLFQSTRANVYFLWAVLTGVGFVATHYYQQANINIVWTVLSVIGLGYMFKVMPLGVSQMKKIFAAWLIPIVLGMIVSVAVVRTGVYPELVGYLGVFWLVVMAIGYGWNGLVDQPAAWYYVAVVLNLAAAALIYSFDSLLQVQYLVAAIVSIWSMLNLWIFRSEV